MNGSGQPPDWSQELLAAEDWGVPPWVVHNGSAVWFERWKYQKDQIDKKLAKERKKSGG